MVLTIRRSLSESFRFFFQNFSRLFHCSVIKVHSWCFSIFTDYFSESIITLFFGASAKTILSQVFFFVNTFFELFFNQLQLAQKSRLA